MAETTGSVTPAGFTGGLELDPRDAGHAHCLAKQGLYIKEILMLPCGMVFFAFGEVVCECSNI